jgi:hypothetical protein
MEPKATTAAEADQALIRHAAAHGFREINRRPLNGRQFKRWRSYGVMPPRQRRGKGRGEGVLVAEHPIAKPQLIALLSLLQRWRSLRYAAVTLWHANFWVKPGWIQGLVCDVFHEHRSRRPPDGDRDVVSDLAYGEALASVRPMNEEDQRLAAKLAAAWESPSNAPELQLTERELLVYARSDLTETVHGLDPSHVDRRLMSAMQRFDEFDQIDGAGERYSEHAIIPTMLTPVTDDNVIETMSALNDDDLAGVRWWLRTWWERISQLRRLDLELPRQRAKRVRNAREWAWDTDITFDPREPGYNPRMLLVVIGVTAANIKAFQPDFFTANG